jgi:hypothetical protein
LKKHRKYFRGPFSARLQPPSFVELSLPAITLLPLGGHFMKLPAVLGAIAMMSGLVCNSCLAALLVTDQVNGNQTPSAGAFFGLNGEFGWFYTPAFSYDLASVETRFASPVDGRDVTVQLFDDVPANGRQLAVWQDRQFHS